MMNKEEYSFSPARKVEKKPMYSLILGTDYVIQGTNHVISVTD